MPLQRPGNNARRALLALVGAGFAVAAPAAYRWSLPPGFPVPRVPADNPMSAAKVDLGRALFFDSRLSVTGRYSCASCHRPELGFSDGRALAVGATGAVLPRGAMSLYNVAYAVSLGWRKPGAASLEAQMLQPLFNEHPLEMGLAGRESALLAELAADAAMRRQFAVAFRGSRTALSMRHVIQSIASFERTLIAGGAPFDRYVFDDQRAALGEGAKRGMTLFFSARGGCSQCHFGIGFSGPTAIAGRPVPAAAFADSATGGVFKIPGLRNLQQTAPYMHDGRFADLAAVLAHYENPSRDAAGGEMIDPRLQPLRLDAGEKQDLIDFLRSLSSLQSPVGGPSTSDSAVH